MDCGRSDSILRSTWEGGGVCEMASADLRKELECSVCLNIYTDPVMLKCGHNFCRDCIGRVLDTQEGPGGYFCPECREEFQKWPALQKSIEMRNIVETVQASQPDQEKTEIFCTYCIDTPVPAVKSCLMCEASLCDDHLRVHSKTPEHVLCDPTTSLENKKCSIHKELLRYYCTEDSTCICVSCSVVGEHRGHRVETTDEASEKKKKKLRNVLQKLMTEREKTEKRVQSLQEHRRKVQDKAAGERKRVIALFRDLRKKLKDLQRGVLGKISEQAEQVSLPLLDVIQKLEKKKGKLSRKVRHLKKLCNMTDPVMVLQDLDTGDLCDTEDGDDEDRERHDKLLHDGGDLDVGGISHTLHTGLSDIMSGVNVQKCTGTLVSPRSKTKNKVRIHAESSRPQPQPTPTMQPFRPQPQPTPTMQPFRPQPTPTMQPFRPPPQPTPSVQPFKPQPTPTIQPFRPQPSPTKQPFKPQPTLTKQPFKPQPFKSQPTPTKQPFKPQPQPTLMVQDSHCQSGGPNIGAVQQTSGVPLFADILLDVKTAGNRIQISDDRKAASWSDHSQNRPEIPERFQNYPQVMSSQSFSSGQHYWEVDVGGSGDWIVGMCYPSIDRREGQSLIGGNKSWGLERWGWDNQYLTIHDRKKAQLHRSVAIKKVRIDLDYEAGQISFYDPCDLIRPLHTFTTTFTEPLHAILYVGDGSVKISGGGSDVRRDLPRDR
ncbi:E3 ubiquitin/ISG15 ligase TRIM25-like [Aquarana catesbeiana]|uniref:E3 ubiquitin/ISG15 ligase TRIM25-like n=1 Tax=Aquarana catesbeiana TaxID=8400 RepID=UPI003CC9F477